MTRDDPLSRNCSQPRNCSLARALDIVGEWWSLLVVRETFFGAHRFQDYVDNLGIARNILSARLKRLVGAGVLARIEGEGGTVEYRLTAKGEALMPVLVALLQWGDAHANPEPKPVILVDRLHGQPIAPLTLQAADGRPLGPRDIRALPGPGADDRLRRRLAPRRVTRVADGA